MAGELIAKNASGTTVVAQVWLRGQVANVLTQALEAYSDANWAAYAVPMVEQGVSGTFIGDFPAWLVAVARYSLLAYEVADSTPTGDLLIAGPSAFDWPITVTTTPPSVAAIDAQLSGAHGAGLWTGGAGGDPATIAAAVWVAPQRTLTTFVPPPPSWFPSRMVSARDLLYKTGDTIPYIEQTLPLPVGVTTIAGWVVTFVMTREDDPTERVSAVATHTSDDPPVVRFTPGPNDFSVPGSYIYEWRCVRNADNAKFTVPGSGRGKIVIEAAL